MALAVASTGEEAESVAVDTGVIAIDFVDDRDGEQQYLPDASADPEERIGQRWAITQMLVDGGARKVELGHGANDEVDIEFIKRTIDAEREAQAGGESVLNGASIQMLFQSIPEQVAGHIGVFDRSDRDRTVIHIYDRIADGLRGLAASPLSIRQAAQRTVDAAQVAIDHGYFNFSFSGEGATDVEPEVAAEFSNIITDGVMAASGGRAKVNHNLANTYGKSPIYDWGPYGLHAYNSAVKVGPDITTSVHTHNDFGSAADFAVAAIRAGFNSAEATKYGTGERTGNLAAINIVARLLEDAQERVRLIEQGRDPSTFVDCIDWTSRYIDVAVIEGMGSWYENGRRMAEIYGITDRFENTVLGFPYAFASGSGPHDHAVAKALENPVDHPLWGNYGYAAGPHALLGNPLAQGIMAANPEALTSIIVNGHAGGSNTQRIVDGSVKYASPDKVAEAAALGTQRLDRIVETISAQTR